MVWRHDGTNGRGGRCHNASPMLAFACADTNVHTFSPPLPFSSHISHTLPRVRLNCFSHAGFFSHNDTFCVFHAPLLNALLVPPLCFSRHWTSSSRVSVYSVPCRSRIFAATILTTSPPGLHCSPPSTWFSYIACQPVQFSNRGRLPGSVLILLSCLHLSRLESLLSGTLSAFCRSLLHALAGLYHQHFNAFSNLPFLVLDLARRCAYSNCVLAHARTTFSFRYPLCSATQNVAARTQAHVRSHFPAPPVHPSPRQTDRTGGSATRYSLMRASSRFGTVLQQQDERCFTTTQHHHQDTPHGRDAHGSRRALARQHGFILVILLPPNTAWTSVLF